MSAEAVFFATGVVIGLFVILFFTVTWAQGDTVFRLGLLHKQLDDIRHQIVMTRGSAQAAEATANEVKETLSRVFRVEDKPE